VLSGFGISISGVGTGTGEETTVKLDGPTPGEKTVGLGCSTIPFDGHPDTLSTVEPILPKISSQGYINEDSLKKPRTALECDS